MKKMLLSLIGLFLLSIIFANSALAQAFPENTNLISPPDAFPSDTTAPAVSTSGGAGSQQTFASISFTGLENPSKLSSLDELFNKYLPEIIALVGGLIFMIVLLVGGFLYITSAGNEEQAERGKRTIMWAVIGIIIIAIAYAAVAWFKQQAGMK